MHRLCLNTPLNKFLNVDKARAHIILILHFLLGNEDVRNEDLFLVLLRHRGRVLLHEGVLHCMASAPIENNNMDLSSSNISPYTYIYGRFYKWNLKIFSIYRKFWHHVPVVATLGKQVDDTPARVHI